MLPDDLNENSSKVVLLTGSGFSKDFGGLLVPDIWMRVYNSDKSNESIRETLRGVVNDNYELAISQLKTEEDISLFMDVLGSIFEEFDRIIASSNSVLESISKFIEIIKNDKKYYFIFSTNQDLLIERTYLHMIQQKMIPGKTLYDIVNFPCVDFKLSEVLKNTQSNTIESQNNYSFRDFNKIVKLVKDQSNIEGLNYVKLHGSFNWQHSDDYVIQISGDDKIVKLKSEKLLDLGYELFQKIMLEKNIIVIVGYGFNDPHINEQIYSSISQGSKIVIIMPLKFSLFLNLEFPFSNNPQYKRIKIIEGVSKYYNCGLLDFINGQKGYFEDLNKYIKSF